MRLSDSKAARPADTKKKDATTDQTNGTLPRPKVQELKKDWEDTNAKDANKVEANSKTMTEINDLEAALII